jgi:hypothetical protein
MTLACQTNDLRDQARFPHAGFGRDAHDLTVTQQRGCKFLFDQGQFSCAAHHGQGILWFMQADAMPYPGCDQPKDRDRL